ncbi:hypothetical protein ASE08_16020 [Rhizobacter sp. Root16D2]|nr:hypothetical protein ASC88_00640 [Rhizobacter sp. Root29]KQW12246.1 hypothetical protein ASC98_20930 [Rhizobacter sp. Root1238]KRB03061.1 hypothetical protein ASE08_16020 [Rhizobacter sp. Root16D2]
MQRHDFVGVVACLFDRFRHFRQRKFQFLVMRFFIRGCLADGLERNMTIAIVWKENNLDLFFFYEVFQEI